MIEFLRKYWLPVGGGSAAGLVAIVVVLIVAGGSEPPPPPAPPPPPRPTRIDPSYDVRFYHQDLGRERKITVLVTANVKPTAADFVMVDPERNEYAGFPVDPPDFFLRDATPGPNVIALFFRPAYAASGLDLRLPGGATMPVYRRPGPASYHPFGASAVACDDWSITATGRPLANGGLEVEISAMAAVAVPLSLNPKRFALLTDAGDALAPEVVSESPLRLRYANLPPGAREFRIQTNFRDAQPEYLVYRPGAAPAPPPPAAPPVPAGGLRAAFAAKSADPVAALRFLSENGSPEARALGREFLAKAIEEETAMGLRAFLEYNAAAAEPRLTRAALLASPYSPEYARQVMRTFFLMRKPRQAPAGCAACGGAGASPCASCKGGQARGDCPRCLAKGQVSCILCDGSGTQDHQGYKGTIVLTLEKDTRARNEKGQQGTLHACTLTYRMSPCAGGRFHLQVEKVPGCSHTENQPSSQAIDQPCEKFWNEMRLFVFSGRAKIQILGRQGRLSPFSSSAARRFLADYEQCRAGRVACDRCAGRRQEACSMCAGAGKADLLCPFCDGTAVKACVSCLGCGDASWLRRLIPEAPALGRALDFDAMRLREWMDGSARAAWRREELSRRLQEAKKGLDPTARVTPDFVEVNCPKCRGAAGDCEECWSTGRREYFEGSAAYQRYALASRLERQWADAGKVAPPAFLALPRREDGQAVARPAPPPPPPAAPRTPAGLPPDVESSIRRADDLQESGKAHLTRLRTSTDQNVWMEAAGRALADLREAQTIYTWCQERLDELGIAAPKPLLDKVRANLQALVVARRASP